MDFQKIINKRKSIRTFEPKKVPKNVLVDLIKDAVKAPNASNAQSWRFYIVNKEATRKKITNVLWICYSRFKAKIKNKPLDKYQKIANEFYSNFGGAQNIILIYRDSASTKYPEMQIQSVSAAIENMVLSAVNKGLGTCWMGTLNGPIEKKKLKKILKTPVHHELVATLVIGYPKKGFKPLKRKKKKLDEIMKFV